MTNFQQTQRELEQITQWIKEATTKPNADENIQLILKLASNSITQDKVENLVKPTNPDTKLHEKGDCQNVENVQERIYRKRTCRARSQTPKQ